MDYSEKHSCRGGRALDVIVEKLSVGHFFVAISVCYPRCYPELFRPTVKAP